MVEMEPINLVTGLPGAGKTLFAIYLSNKCREEGLTPLNFNIEGLSSDIAESWPGPLDQWEKFDGDELAKAQQAAIANWQSLPPKSVLLIDEAHRVFPVRPTHSKEPAHVNALAEIRHKGVRLIIVDQDPSTLDRFVKRRVGAHYHLVNRSGFDVARLFSNRSCVDNPRVGGAWGTGESELWRYPKELFSKYKSASVHIKKRRIPKMFIVLAAAVVLAIASFWWTGAKFMSTGERDIDPSAVVTTYAGERSPTSAWAQGIVPPQQRQQVGYLTAADWAHAHTPLVKGVPWSAPVYAGLAIQTVPDLRCIIIGDHQTWGSRCKCYSEQGTTLDVDQKFCRMAALNGVYNPYRRPMATAPVDGQKAQGGGVPPAEFTNAGGTAAAFAEPVYQSRAAVGPPPVADFRGVR